VSVDNHFSWDMTYLGINLGLDYEFYRPGNFTFYGRAMVSPEFLLRGTQTINNQVYDLIGEDDFDTPMLFMRLGLGAQYRISELISVYLQYMGGKSYALKGDSEKLNLISHNIGLGVLFNLSAVTGTGSSPASDKKLQELEQKLEIQSQKIEELEAKDEQAESLKQQVQAKEVEMEELKDNISQALFDVSPEGLQIYQSEGKIYVIMDNDLLFESGSWEVSAQGEKAVEALGVVLAENPESSILIEGHTDNQPFRGAGNIRDNWDLSLKRATAIVEILNRNPGINQERLIAAGRGEHNPKASNETEEGRALNRRTEIIINPQLSKAYQLLED
jgi:flagellar motor protein MotB